MPKKIIPDSPPIVWRNSTFTWKQKVGNVWKRRQQTISLYLTQKDLERGRTFKDKEIDYWNIKVGKLEQESGEITKDYEWGLTGEETAIAPKRIRTRIKMKHFVFDLADEVEQSWDTKTGRCVFDYLIYKFKEVKGFKKKMKYDYLNALFRCEEVEDEVNPLEQGVSIEQLRKFCDEFCIRMYAFDEDEAIIEMYLPLKVKYETPLMFRIFNDHFYPIENTTKRKSMSGKTTSTNGYKTKEIPKLSNMEGIPTYYQMINPTDKLDLENRNKFALEHLFRIGKISFPIKPKNFSYNQGSIKHIISEGNYISTSPIDEVSKYLTDKYFNGLYQGENLTNLLYKLWEKAYDEPFTINPMKSTYNIDVFNALRTDGVKTRTHYGLTNEEHLQYLEPVDSRFPNSVIFEDMDNTIDFRTIIQKLLDDGGAKCYDIEKCYSSLILNPMDIWIKLDFTSIIEPYEEIEGNLDLGLYFLETNDLTLLHQSNWYSNKIVDYARKEGIEFRIVYQIIDCSDDFYYNKNEGDTHKGEFFKPFLDAVLGISLEDKEIEKSAKKLLINQITGLLGKTSTSSSKVGLHNTANGVWDLILKDIEKGGNPNELCVEELTYEDKKLWVYGSNYKEVALNDNLPMYIQILDWSNILLYELQKKIGGTCIYRKTDCVVMVGGRDLELDAKTSETSNWGKPRIEDVEKAKCLNFKYPMRVDRNIPTPKLYKDWRVYYELTDSNQAEEIVRTFLENGGGLIEGRAGTGKTFVIKEAIRLGLLDDDERFRWCFTNKASRNLGGITIHSALKLDMKTLKATKKQLDFYAKSENRWVVIDEIGMISRELWDTLQYVKKKTNLNFILLGDFRQIPPVEEDRDFEDILEDLDYFNHPTIKYMANYNKCELNTMKRYDLALWNYAEQVSLDMKKGLEQEMLIDSVEKLLKVRNLCYSNNVRKSINNTCQAYMIEKMPYIYLPYEGNDRAYRYNAYIYEGLPIMAIEGSRELDFCNSDEFVVKSFTDAKIIIEDENRELEINISMFHMKFVVNYASTTHKVQGLTIEKDILIWESIFMDKKLLYTAITRARKLEQVYNPNVAIEMKGKDWVLDL